MAIVQSFKEWRAELEGAGVLVEVISDYKNLQHFMTLKHLSRHQARWSEYLSRFNFKLVYRPGVQGGKPNALTRRSVDLSQNNEDDRYQYQNQTVIKSNNLSPGILPISVYRNTMSRDNDDSQPSLDELISIAYKRDTMPSKIMETIRKGDWHLSLDLARLKIPLPAFVKRDGRLYIRDRLYAPDNKALRLRLLQSCHNNVVARYPRRAKTYELLSRNYYWPKMNQIVRWYIRNCYTYSRSKTSQMRYQGLL